MEEYKLGVKSAEFINLREVGSGKREEELK